MTPPTGQLPTRQQLDEIDALLRRMLSLPSMAGESAAPPTPPVAPLSSTTFPAPSIRETHPSAPPAPQEPVVHSWRVEWPQAPAQPTPPASVVSWGTPVAAPVQPAPWVPPTAPPQPAQPPFAAPVPGAEKPTLPVAAPAPEQASVPPLSNSKQTSIFIWFLIVLNGVFDIVCFLLGPLGTWLRGSGRISLGFAGIVMILAAGVWALGNWYGYQWPHIPIDRVKLPL